MSAINSSNLLNQIATIPTTQIIPSSSLPHKFTALPLDTLPLSCSARIFQFLSDTTLLQVNKNWRFLNEISMTYAWNESLPRFQANPLIVTYLNRLNQNGKVANNGLGREYYLRLYKAIQIDYPQVVSTIQQSSGEKIISTRFFEQLAFRIQELQNTSLQIAWPQMFKSLEQVNTPNLPSTSASAKEIRDWFAENEDNPCIKYVTTLELDGLGLLVVPEEIKRFSNLEALNLSQNLLSDLHPKTFSDLRVLKSLKLGSNRLTALPEGIFSALMDLDVLSLQENELTSLPKEIFSGLLYLTILELDHNNLSDLDSETFSELIRLEELALNGNRLTLLRPGIFRTLTFLKSLDLEENLLADLDPKIFENLVVLDCLFLNKNNFVTLSEEVFKGLFRLRFLVLTNNPFTSLPSGIFSDLKKSANIRLDREINSYYLPLRENAEEQKSSNSNSHEKKKRKK